MVMGIQNPEYIRSLDRMFFFFNRQLRVNYICGKISALAQARLDSGKRGSDLNKKDNKWIQATLFLIQIISLFYIRQQPG